MMKYLHKSKKFAIIFEISKEINRKYALMVRGFV